MGISCDGSGIPGLPPRPAGRHERFEIGPQIGHYGPLVDTAAGLPPGPVCTDHARTPAHPSVRPHAKAHKPREVAGLQLGAPVWALG